MITWIQGFKIDAEYCGLLKSSKTMGQATAEMITHTKKLLLLTSNGTIKDIFANARKIRAPCHQIETEPDIYSLLSGTDHECVNTIHIIKDSGFCSCAYILDFDRAVLSVFVGGQRRSQAGNPFGCSRTLAGFYPCAHVGNIPFSQIIQYDSQKLAKTISKFQTQGNR